MFSTEEKRKIADEIEKLLLSFNHPEMPKEKPSFHLKVEGKEEWSWAIIIPNWLVGDNPDTSHWNEHAREYMNKEN